MINVFIKNCYKQNNDMDEVSRMNKCPDAKECKQKNVLNNEMRYSKVVDEEMY